MFNGKMPIFLSNLMNKHDLLRIELFYVILYPAVFILWTLAFQHWHITTGDTLLDVAVLMLLTGVLSFLIAWTVGSRKKK
jgi:hypothetical protein